MVAPGAIKSPCRHGEAARSAGSQGMHRWVAQGRPRCRRGARRLDCREKCARRDEVIEPAGRATLSATRKCAEEAGPFFFEERAPGNEDKSAGFAPQETSAWRAFAQGERASLPPVARHFAPGDFEQRGELLERLAEVTRDLRADLQRLGVEDAGLLAVASLRALRSRHDVKEN